MTGEAVPTRVLVTGGGRGIGAAIVRTLAAAGHDVLFTYRTDEAAARALAADVTAASGRTVDVASVDLADKAAVDAFAGRLAAGDPSSVSSTTRASPTTRCWRCSTRPRPRRSCR